MLVVTACLVAGVAAYGPLSNGESSAHASRLQQKAPAAEHNASDAAQDHQPTQRDVVLSQLLTRAGTYLTGYIPLFSAVTGEEEYRQHFVRKPTVSATIGGAYVTANRTLRSDFVLVRMPTAFMTFRDVTAIDGKPIREPGNRLEDTFLANWITAVVRAAEIDDTCRQYDIGDVTRALNSPVTVLWFLDPSNQERFEFKLGDEETVEGVRTSRIDYRETASPTFLAPDRADAFATGAVWVEANTGRVVKTVLKLSYPRERRWLNLNATVLFRPVEALGLWLPTDMQERWQSGVGDTTTGASYTKYRKFQAPTSGR